MRRFRHPVAGRTRSRTRSRARTRSRSRGRVAPHGRFTRGPTRWVASAPGTYLWLGILFLTTVALHLMSPHVEEEFLRQRSTDIHELSTHPVRVLVAGAFWIDGSDWVAAWLPYALLYTVFHAPAERWLGTARWLAVAALAHIGAGLVSEGVLDWAIHHGHAHPSAVNSLDVGVSYALAGVATVLTYRVPRPWHLPYAGALLIIYGVPLVTGRTFTDLGHFTAALIGLACYPLTRQALSRPPRKDLDTGGGPGVRTPT